MTLFVSVRLDSSVLETSIERADDVDVSLEQQTATTEDSLDLTLHVTGDERSLSEFEDGADEDPTVARWIRVGGDDEQRLYQVRVSEEASSTLAYHEWTDGKVVFLSGECESRGWTLEVYLPDRSVLQQLGAGSESNGVQFDLLQVSEVDHFQDTERFGLSEVQAETLLTALEQGFYSVPREDNLEELAEPLDVSHQAVSERLRRGMCSLIENTIAD